MGHSHFLQIVVPRIAALNAEVANGVRRSSSRSRQNANRKELGFNCKALDWGADR